MCHITGYSGSLGLLFGFELMQEVNRLSLKFAPFFLYFTEKRGQSLRRKNRKTLKSMLVLRQPAELQKVLRRSVCVFRREGVGRGSRRRSF